MMDLEELFAMPEEQPEEKELDRDIMARIKQRRRQLLVHSYMYYRMNDSIIDDHKYDSFARELIELQEKYPAEAEATEFAEDFKGFQMGDSFALPMDQPWIHDKCLRLLRYHDSKKEA